MFFRLRPHTYAIGILSIFAIAALAACASTQSSQAVQVNTPPPPPPEPQIAPFLNAMPHGSEDPDEVFFYADGAFHAGNFAISHRDFSLLYVLAPGFQGGVPAQALAITCVNLGINCELSFARLDLQRSAFGGQFGPMSAWVPQQSNDFRSIIACYDRVLIGDFPGAVSAGQPVVGAPLPEFSSAASRCVDYANSQLAASQQQQVIDAALLVWFDNYPCMNEHRTTLLDAYNAGDWEAFVGAYPQYQRCAAPLQEIIDNQTLEGNSALGMEHDIAWTNMDEIAFILDDHRAEFNDVNAALTALDNDPEYDRRLVEWNQLTFEETRILNQISSTEGVLENLSGGARAPVEAQIQTQQAQLRDVRNRQRETLGAINAVRAAHGLPPRDRP